MILSFLFACQVLSQTSKTYSFIGLLERGEIIDVRITESSFGVLKNQGHLRLNLWLPFQPPISLGIHSLPVQTSFHSDPILIEHAEFSLKKGSVDLRGKDYGMSLRLNKGNKWNSKDTPPLWSDVLIQGWVTSGKRSLPISGLGIMLYREEALSTYLSTERSTLWIEGGQESPSFYIERELRNSEETCFLWTQRDAPPEECTLKLNGTELELHTSSFQKTIKVLRNMGLENPHETLFMPERLLSSPHNRYIYTAQMEGRRTVWIHRGTEPVLSDLLPKPTDRSQKSRQNNSAQKKKDAQKNKP